MNRTYRTVWSSVRNAYVVASEKAKSRGKPSSTRTAVASAVALALTALAMPQALAVTSCNSTVGNPQMIPVTVAESACTLVAADQLTVNAGASIASSTATPVSVAGISPATSLNNAGDLSFTYVPSTGTNPWNGIYSPVVSGPFTTITNSGTIRGLGGPMPTSVGGGTGGGSAGIVLYGTSGTLTNSGTISGHFGAVNIGNTSPTGLVPVSTGTLSSLVNSGTITSKGGAAVHVTGGSALTDFLNQGGGNITGVNGARGFWAEGATLGTITNNTGSTISGAGTGFAALHLAGYWGPSSAPLVQSTLTGGLTNTGTILGTQDNAILIEDTVIGSASTPANIINSGPGIIRSNGSRAMVIQNSTLHGDIINEVGATIRSGVTGTASSSTRYYSAIVINGSALGSISNSGQINGGIMVNQNSSLSGSITNANGGTIYGAGTWAAIGVRETLMAPTTIAGDVINAGTIGADFLGISIENATVTGAINNSGSISVAVGNSAGGTGIRMFGGSVGSITNSGSITTTSRNGVYLSTGFSITGDFTNTVNGVIRSIGQGSGDIGMRVAGGSIGGSLINHGTIEGGRWGLSIVDTSVTGGIVNSGNILGGANGAGFYTFSTANSAVGGLTNSGLIQGGIGILIDNQSGLPTINNSGTISGTAAATASGYGGYGIYLRNSTLTSITNSGTISGTKAIWVDTVTNGTTSVLTDLFIDGNNTAQFNGMVDALATNVTILNGATYTLRSTDNFNVASFTNDGTMALLAGSTATLPAYTQTAAGTLRIGASDNTTYGKLVVSGTATLPSNAKIDVNVTNPNFAFTTNSMAGVLTAGTLTSDGTFTVTDNSVLFNFTARKNGNAVDLALASTSGTGNTSTAFTKVSNTAGARAASVIDKLVSNYTANGTSGNAGMDAVLAKLGTYTTDAALVEAVMQTVPQVGAALKRVSTTARASVTSALAARIRGGSSGDEFVTNGNAWFKPLGAWTKQNDNAGTTGYKANTYGLVVGVDGETGSGARIGAALGMTRTNVDGNSGLQSGKVTGYQAALYGGMDAGSYQLGWQADVSYNQNSGTRRIAFMNTTASSDYSGTAVHMGASVARDWLLASGDVLTPSLRADYTHLRDKAYTETGAGALNLAVAGQIFHELLLVADGTWTHHLDSGANLSANLGVAYDAHAKQDDITSAYAGGGAAFGTSGIKPSATTARAGLGYGQTTAGGMDVSVRYDVEGRSGYTAQSFSARLAKPF